jgi:hypothetical protein
MGSLLINPKMLYLSKYINKITGEQFTSSQYAHIEGAPYIDGSLSLYEAFQILKRIEKCPLEINNSNYEDHEQVIRNLQETYIDVDNYEQINVTDTYADGYAIYNGELNTTDDIYVNKRYPLSLAELKLLECDEDTYPAVIFNLMKECGFIHINSDISDYSDEEIYESLLHFKGTVYAEEPPKYRVWHEGNLDPNKIITNPMDVVSILRSLPSPIDINVRRLGGLTLDQLLSSISDMVGVEFITRPEVEDLIDESLGYRAEIISTNGNLFTNTKINTTLQVKVYKGNVEITNTLPDECFVWKRVSLNPQEDEYWNSQHLNKGSQITITHEDVFERATFFCEIY